MSTGTPLGSIGGREYHGEGQEQKRRLVIELRQRGSLVEYQRKALTTRGELLVDADGRLHRRVEGVAFHGHKHLPDGLDRATGFFVDATGTPVLIEHADPYTVERLEANEQAAERHRHQAEADQAKRHRAFRGAQPLAPLTIADLSPDRAALTLRQAYDHLVDAGCRVESTATGFRILAPARYAQDDGDELAARERVRAAARVLDQARELVRDRLAASKALPDRPPLVGGG